MAHNNRIKVLFLAKSLPPDMKIMDAYKSRVSCLWVNEADVPSVLSSCDYGILLRERSVTNKVSSPVKFAEYLACGLKILISPEIGDYSEYVVRNECGLLVIDPSQPLNLFPVLFAEKQKLNLLALDHFSKGAYREKYRKAVL